MLYCLSAEVVAHFVRSVNCFFSFPCFLTYYQVLEVGVGEMVDQA